MKTPKQFLLLFLLFLLFFLFGNINSKTLEVIINEISTNSNLVDINGDYSDWIELYNTGNKKVDISGYGLSNEFYLPFKWRFPKETIINPGEYLIVYASEKKTNENELHTNFKLYKKGDTLYFNDPKANVIETIKIPSLEENETYGKIGNIWTKTIPTPISKNQKILAPPIFSKNSGFYDNDFLLILSTSASENEIYYTLDGSDPQNSNTTKKYVEPILIHDRTEEPNYYSAFGEIRNSSKSISLGSNYRTPIYNVDKAMIVRAFAKNAIGYSKVIDCTYFVTTNTLVQYKDHTIISLVINPDNLFDPDKGIYVTGNRYIEWLNSDSKEKGPNPPNNILNYFSRGSEWEREVSVTIFEKGEVEVKQNMGIRIKGSSTRGNPGKSFNLSTKKKYGESYINNKIFPNNKDINGKLIEKYSSLSLICITSEGRLRNEIATKTLRKRIDLTTTEMKNGIVFLNGEYWGMYVISEKFTDDFIESHYNIPSKNVAMNKQGSVEEGPEEEFDNFKNFGKEYSKKNLSDTENYEEVSNVFDIDSLIEHYASGIYLGTTDWPNYNYGVWRNMGENIKGNKFSDGKWRFMTYDLDKTMGNNYYDLGGLPVYAYNMFNHTLQKSKSAPTSLFIALLQNEEFRNKFINVYCDYVNDVMSLDKINPLLEQFKEDTTEILAYSLQRWRGYNRPLLEGFAKYKKQFLSTLNNIKTYFIERPYYSLIHMKEFLNLTGDYYELTLIKEGNGKIKVNSIVPNLDNEEWKGIYFYNIPIQITAIPANNYKFIGWSEDFESNKDDILLSLSQNMIVKATFQKLN